ncbi:methyltransferase domain-containing protein [Streptosporangiaceae bacterium NEAU-GS5]|nr:methyltransferase domain-containing protein [Streptosporangiaceae bacterium NEAU-GS5]
MRDATRQGVVWDALRVVLSALTEATGRPILDIVDAGGGTGGFAVPLATLGHGVTVVDPTPDSLAALERRAAESGVSVKGIQGDAADLAGLLAPQSADLVLCHSMLEFVDDPAGALAAVAGLLRPGGVVSLLTANPVATAIHRAQAGYFDEAAQILSDPLGRWGAKDPTPRRFTTTAMAALLAGAGFEVRETHGVRIFADLVPSRLADSHPAALLALEQAAAAHPMLREIATQLHYIAAKSN